MISLRKKMLTSAMIATLAVPMLAACGGTGTTETAPTAGSAAAPTAGSLAPTADAGSTAPTADAGSTSPTAAPAATTGGTGSTAPPKVPPLALLAISPRLPWKTARRSAWW